MKTATIKAPAMQDGKIVYVEKTGVVAWLDLGGKREKFILQFEGVDNRPRYVTHYATGQKMPGDLQGRAMGLLLSRGHAHPINYRAIAQQIIAETVEQNGLERVRKVIAAAPIVNA